MNKINKTMKLRNQEFKKNIIQKFGKKIVLITTLLLFTFSIQAQDKKAKQLLDEVTAKVSSYNNITIDLNIL
jgi:hypothetical protein